MVKRPFWLEKVRRAWDRRPVLWLTGARRVGKTSLVHMLPDVEYFDCELPRDRQIMGDPQGFLDRLRGKTIVLDEIHRLRRPAELLKIAADHYPGIRVLATGSSTLAATRKFRDSLAGRKSELWLTPMNTADLEAFQNPDLSSRLLKGGLPPFFLAATPSGRDHQEWMDAFWAKDIQELFRVAQRDPFMKFLELLLVNSGGIFEATHYARPCEVDRKTIVNYLRALEITHLAHVLRPFSSRKVSEIVSAPKVYGFDTGFVCYYRGWNSLRPADYGPLWEHFVLNEIQSNLQTRRVQYWRNKKGHEVDFILLQRDGKPIAVECKWSSSDFNPKAFVEFATAYPRADFYVVSQDVSRPFSRKSGGLSIEFLNLTDLIRRLRKVEDLLSL
jgi:predicted AAA+ superfamily ATPase